MDSFGEILKNARESRNLTFDTVAREISIDKRYLQGLENEDNGAFPGEPYLIGFLKNYSDYLGLNTELLLKLYYNKKIQESPVPEELLKKRKSPIVPIVFITLPVLLIAAGVVFFFIFFKKPPIDEDEVLLSGSTKIHKYELSEKKFTGRLYKGDQLYVPTSDGQLILTVKDTLESFGLDTPLGVFYTELAEEAEFDITGDGVSDLIVYISDISSTDESRGAEVSFLLLNGTSLASPMLVDDIPLANEIQSKHPQIVIHEDNRAYPFTLNATFRASCVFRDKVDRAATSESYFSNGEVFTATAQNGIRVWMSNSNAVKFTIIADSKSFDLEMGKAGQVLVEDIKWIKDSDGRYKLVVIELD